MIELQHDLDANWEVPESNLPLTFHSSFSTVHQRIKKWLARFPFSADNSIFSDLLLLYLLATKQFLDHRIPAHLYRLVLSMHLMQKKLLRLTTFSSQTRHLEIKWVPTELIFPFSSKPVLGCLIGFNLMDRYDVFDEENIFLALQKYLPELRLVKESSYCHTSQNKNLKIFYLEIEKKDGSGFSLKEQNILKENLEEKVKNSIQTLSPAIFMGLNEEELYKNILVLSQEIQSLQDPPQAYITLDQQQTGKEIVFRITLVQISPFHRFSLKERFIDCAFVSQRVSTVRHLDNHPIEANIFCLYLPRDASLLRSDGSLDFYSARQKVVNLMKAAIGEFRDFNGGIIVKQQQLLQAFKEEFPDLAFRDPELMESFFYALTPLEKQIMLDKQTIATLFSYFLETRKTKLPDGSSYSLKIYKQEKETYIIVHGDNSSLIENISTFLQEHAYKSKEIAYNFLNAAEGVFFNCILLKTESVANTESFINNLKEYLSSWQKSKKEQQSLKIGMEFTIVSLDPRIGGEDVSGNILGFLFEGLTRFNKNGQVENAVAESIEISSNSRVYLFKLRSSFWNNGSPVTAHDFEYAWKKILSPDFKTSFAYFFYPIKNAKEAKEGKVSLDQVGIHVIDDHSLKVELVHPTPYFLQCTAHPLFSPINRTIDQQHPQWPYQSEKNYPCNGPFQLKMNQPNQGFELVKNSFYWDIKNVTLDQVTLTLMNPSQAIQAFQRNQIDWVGNPCGGWHSFYVPGNEDHILSFPNSLVCWSVFNTNRPPFHHRKMRQAFAYAIQRSQITNNAFLPLNAAYSPLLPHYRENCPSQFPDYNPEKARQLLHEALQELNMSLSDLSPLTISYNEKGIREYAALCLSKQLMDSLGIECDLKPLSWKIYHNRIIGGDFQLGLMHWTSLIDDPIYTLNAFRTANQEINFAKWENPHFQHLLCLSDNEVNPFIRSSYLSEAEDILCQEMPIIPLFYQPIQCLVKKNVHMQYRAPSGPFNLARCYKQKG